MSLIVLLENLGRVDILWKPVVRTFWLGTTIGSLLIYEPPG
jgi:hypothetical protein